MFNKKKNKDTENYRGYYFLKTEIDIMNYRFVYEYI